MLAILLLLFALNAGDPGPVVETCAFLPADDPCHNPPPPELCYDERGVPADCPPI